VRTLKNVALRFFAEQTFFRFSCPVFSPRRKLYEPEAIIPLFHHSMWLTKTMAAKNTVIPINFRNFDTF
jgi:hypothetical protein